MPYIPEKRRIEILHGELPNTTGELNYNITYLLREYYKSHGQNYQAMNDVMGALEGAKMEFYRRVAAPYEDQKIKENGDVY